ncbi:MAG TPA: pyridoxamine 5'-phosphate oxidase family protein [Solirubrobacteraceae bacterium]|nr:pyridoxamine 5'-phosphate oxidase family protein [Solirubrobacteraceae bacterium]
MRLSDEEALARLRAHDHGVLCTVHPKRGVDVIPVVYVIDPDGYVALPIDRVKPKLAPRLQRERNLERDPRAALLAERWDASDWTKLWWVRAQLRHEPDPGEREPALAAALAGRYPQYRGEAPFVRLLVLRIVGLTGWAGTEDATS